MRGFDLARFKKLPDLRDLVLGQIVADIGKTNCMPAQRHADPIARFVVDGTLERVTSNLLRSVLDVANQQSPPHPIVGGRATGINHGSEPECLPGAYLELTRCYPRRIPDN